MRHDRSCIQRFRKAHVGDNRVANRGGPPATSGSADMSMRIVLLVLAAFAAAAALSSADAALAQPQLIAQQRNRVVIQVSDGDQTKWNLALNNAQNIQAD